MTYQVSLHPQAEQDLDFILAWLTQRTTEGARIWYRRWKDVLRQLETAAAECSLAPESEGRKFAIRHLIFKTRHGREYRALFVIQDQMVVVFHVRGPGQDLLSAEEIREHDL
jgi:plasmid stabilization system protein ParE